MSLKIKYNAPVTLTFALICLAVLGGRYALGYSFLQNFFMTYDSGWLNLMTYVRLFTYVFGHVDWSHFFGNMSYILVLGPMIEEKYGSRNVMFMIAITAVIGGVLNNVLFPNTALCGASGIVFMMIILSSITSIEHHTIPLTLILVMVIYLGGEIYDAIVAIDSISQFTHIAGGLCGAVFGMSLYRRRR